MSEHPKFSFVMPAFKARYLREAIKSILSQTYTDFELIVVDDCSPEDLYAVVSEIQDSRISYSRNSSNIGGSCLVAQWNYAVSLSKGEFVILASDDDIYTSSFLQAIEDLIKLYPQVSVFRTRGGHISETGDIIKTENWSSLLESEKSKVISENKFLSDLVSGKILSGIPQYVFRKSALLSIGGFVDFPLAWYSDDATVTKIASSSGLAIVDTLGFYMRIWGMSITGGHNSDAIIEKKTISGFLYWTYLTQNITMSYTLSVKLRIYITLGICNLHLYEDWKRYKQNIKKAFGQSWPCPVFSIFIGYLWYLKKKVM